MSDVNVTVQQLRRAGITPTHTGSLSTGNTYQFKNNGKVVLYWKKSGAGACTVTIVTQGTVDGQAVADRTVSVPATTGEKMAGPWSPDLYNNSDGEIEVTYSEITGLTHAAVALE